LGAGDTRGDGGEAKLGGASKFGVEPGAGDLPVAFDGAFGDFEGLGDFGFGEAGEVAHLDDLALAGVLFVEAGEGLVEGEVTGGVAGVVLKVIVEGCGGEAGAAFGGLMGAGMIDEEAAHDGAGEGEEMVAVADGDGCVAEDA
jgi:hypothetical protein